MLVENFELVLDDFAELVVLVAFVRMLDVLCSIDSNTMTPVPEAATGIARPTSTLVVVALVELQVVDVAFVYVTLVALELVDSATGTTVSVDTMITVLDPVAEEVADESRLDVDLVAEAATGTTVSIDTMVTVLDPVAMEVLDESWVDVDLVVDDVMVVDAVTVETSSIVDNLVVVTETVSYIVCVEAWAEAVSVMVSYTVLWLAETVSVTVARIVVGEAEAVVVSVVVDIMVVSATDVLEPPSTSTTE